MLPRLAESWKGWRGTAGCPSCETRGRTHRASQPDSNWILRVAPRPGLERGAVWMKKMRPDHWGNAARASDMSPVVRGEDGAGGYSRCANTAAIDPAIDPLAGNNRLVMTATEREEVVTEN
jgi:hypothetical protein